MPTTVVSGRVAILFDKLRLGVGGGSADEVDAYRCRWCGFTCVIDDPKLLPDHECHGAAAAQGAARDPPPPRT